MRTKRRFVFLLLTVLLLMFCLAACGEEESGTKKGKSRTRDGEKPTGISVTPTGEPTDEPTPIPTAEPTATSTPTPTEAPTPTPTPVPTGPIAELARILGTWFSEDGYYLNVQVNIAETGSQDIQVVYGAQFSDKVGLYGWKNGPSVLPIKKYDVIANEFFTLIGNLDNKEIKMTLEPDYDGSIWFEAEGTGISKHFYKAAGVNWPIQLKEVKAQDFYADNIGFWSSESDYDFLYVLAYRAGKGYAINYSSFYSEWLPNMDIVSVKEALDGKTYYISLQEVEGKQVYRYTVIWKRLEGNRLQATFMNDESGANQTLTLVRGIRFDGVKNMADPEISYAVDLEAGDLQIYLSQYSLAKLKEKWKPYIEAEEGNTVIFEDPASFKHLTVTADAAGVITAISVE